MYAHVFYFYFIILRILLVLHCHTPGILDDNNKIKSQTLNALANILNTFNEKIIHN